MTMLETDRLPRFGRQTMTGVLLFGIVLCVAGCSQEQGDMSATDADHGADRQAASVSPGAPRAAPEEYQEGRKRFESLCARCHGGAGVGTHAGPPLVHAIYKPSHHADFAFVRAAREGVRAHHWDFGDMPNVPEAAPDVIATIIPYVRWLQREAGIF